MTGCGGGKKKDAVPAIKLSNLDTTVAPGDDFYQYACGGWMRNNPLSAEYARFGSFDQLRNDNLDQLHKLVEELRNSRKTEGSIAQKVSTLYDLGMDYEKRNAEDVNPVKDLIEEIRMLSLKGDMSLMLAKLHKIGVSPYFFPFVDADDMNSSMNIAMIQQAGLGMGDRDYYLSDEEATQRIRAAYGEYIERLFQMSGFSLNESKEAHMAVMRVENILARHAYPRELLRDSYRNYNKMTVAEWEARNNFLRWRDYFAVLGIPENAELNVRQIDYYEKINYDLFHEVRFRDHKYYMMFHLLNTAAPYLGDRHEMASFDFYGKTMSGKEAQEPRWKRVLKVTDGAMSEALGQLYVEKYFPASSKEKMLGLVEDLQVALGERIEALEWMSAETKTKAQEKLSTFIVKIGYPDNWRDYSGLQIKNDTYWDNVCRSNIFDTEYMLAKAGKPVDRAEWHMSPQTVNAYYNPTTNEICFPAGILQPPFFNPDADDAVNYGAIGVVIGHEMTHGFDDEGRNYDKDGNLKDWWTPQDAERFKDKADILVEQFDNITVYGDTKANGRYTLGENIADQGGLLVAKQAYENSLKGKKQPGPIDGFTGDQRFYLGYAALWAQNIRPEEMLRLTKLDPHSLGRNRVNATLRNIEDFYHAFDIKEDDPMYMAPEERVVIW